VWHLLEIFSENLRLFLNIFKFFKKPALCKALIFCEIEAFLKICVAFQKIRGFLKHLKGN
jgi:hypothetical protein